ncbi:protease inhibitor I42 family protein [Thiocystis violascens]|uniref:protease inhibitor I42 family protein n=1 Tax=Thiocystis violascens TaxID=73141 RepID=UPI00022C1670|nr:protease inhibitor I42 family protein [Thiocystis violascens]
MSEIAVTQSDRWKTVDAQPGDVIVIRIEENLATGYSWEIVSGEGSVLTLKESNYIESAGMAMGRGGMRLLRFVALARGNQEIRLHLRRPWDLPDKAIEQFGITIRVL